ncbi:MAG: lysine transporter LysE [Anaerolineales bacterium]|nr:MAG: lysine transporter LysE [Anaerolineales bacterium]
MTKLAAIFTTSLMVGFSGTLMPGPLLTVTINQSAQRGFWQGPLLILGHAIAELALVLALTAGLSHLLKRKAVAGIIGLLGGAFLLWMGLDIARSVWCGTVSLSLAGVERSGAQVGPVVTGVLVSVSNPHWVLWWATVGVSYVALALRQGPLGLGSFYVGHILADLSWYSLVAFVITAGRSLLSQPIYQGILLFCGLFLIALSIYFIYSGLNFLRGKGGIPDAG